MSTTAPCANDEDVVEYILQRRGFLKRFPGAQLYDKEANETEAWLAFRRGWEEEKRMTEEASREQGKPEPHLVLVAGKTRRLADLIVEEVARGQGSARAIAERLADRYAWINKRSVQSRVSQVAEDGLIRRSGSRYLPL